MLSSEVKSAGDGDDLTLLPLDDRDPNLRVDRLRERALLLVEDTLALDARLGAPVFSGFCCAVVVDLAGRAVHHDVTALL